MATTLKVPGTDYEIVWLPDGSWLIGQANAVANDIWEWDDSWAGGETTPKSATPEDNINAD